MEKRKTCIHWPWAVNPNLNKKSILTQDHKAKKHGFQRNRWQWRLHKSWFSRYPQHQRRSVIHSTNRSRIPQKTTVSWDRNSVGDDPREAKVCHTGPFSRQDDAAYQEASRVDSITAKLTLFNERTSASNTSKSPSKTQPRVKVLTSAASLT